MDWKQNVYESALFRDFSYEEFERLLPQMHGIVRSVKKGTILLEEGDLVSFGGVVLSGSLATMKIQFDGAVSILDIVLPSKVFGLDMALTPSKVSALSVQSLEDSAIYTFPFSGLRTFCWMPDLQRDRMTENILIHLANENVRKQHKIEIISQYSLRRRILTYLYFMSGRRQAETFSIPFSREQLAWYLCVNRSTLSHELSLMREEGLIRFEKNKFTLLKKSGDAPADERGFRGQADV
jgi:CRP-like cAMP-binding protein